MIAKAKAAIAGGRTDFVYRTSLVELLFTQRHQGGQRTATGSEGLAARTAEITEMHRKFWSKNKQTTRKP